MDWQKKKYQLIIDYFSKYCFLFQMPSATVTAVISDMTALFSLKEIPLEIFTGNGKPFHSKELYAFTDEYGLEYTTEALTTLNPTASQKDMSTA